MIMAEKQLDRQFKLGKEDAADFLRELAESIEDDEEVMLEGDDWKVYQPYQDTIPFRLTQDENGLEVDLKMMPPED